MDQLTATLKKIEKQNYRAYQQIKGQYDFGDFDLYIDYVQGDPYASASVSYTHLTLPTINWV